MRPPAFKDAKGGADHGKWGAGMSSSVLDRPRPQQEQPEQASGSQGQTEEKKPAKAPTAEQKAVEAWWRSRRLSKRQRNQRSWGLRPGRVSQDHMIALSDQSNKQLFDGTNQGLGLLAAVKRKLTPQDLTFHGLSMLARMPAAFPELRLRQECLDLYWGKFLISHPREPGLSSSFCEHW